MFSKRTLLVATGLIAALSSSPVLAHAPVAPLPLPLHHATILLHHAPILLHHAFPTVFRSPGLSGSASAVLLRNKLLTQTGFSTGFNASAQQAISGTISSGQLSGTFYESFAGSNSFNLFPHYVLGFGNNSLNTMGGFAGTAPSTLVNSIVGGSAFGKIHNTGAGLLIPSLRSSGAQRASQIQIKNLVGNSVAAGEKVGNLSFNSPIAGGQFFGTDYFQPGGVPLTYNANATFVYAFGKDTLNLNPITTGTLNLASLRNYIQLANGRVLTYSNGLLPATGYFAGNAVDANWIFAIGKNPLNFFNNFASAPFMVKYSIFPSAFLLR